MPDNEATLPAPAARDLADPTHARRSLRASVDRRLKRARRRRASSGGRRAVVAATCLLALGAAGAAAQESADGGASGSGSPAKSSGAGYDVKAVQRKLGITADGVAGPQTRRAIRRFQKRNGLTADGIVGPQTLKALGLSATSSSTSEAGSGAGSAAGGVTEQLRRIAQCESGGDPTAVSSDGTYRGKYQFSRETWEMLGGEGDPAQAPEAEQDRMAVKLMETQGPSAWPVCSKQ